MFKAGFSSKFLASTAGCLTAEYYAWMSGLQKSSIISCIRGLSTIVSCSTVWSILSSTIVAFFAMLTFLKLLSFLSNSESTGSRSDLGFLCINQQLEMETY